MPKKFDGENSKAAAAKARKEATKAAERQKKEEAEADEYWRDDDKNVAKKQQRKEEKDKKRQEQLTKKAELKALAEQETDSIKHESKQAPSKVTRLQIQAEVEKREAAARAAVAKAKPTKPVEESIPENINRITVEGEVAQTVDEAIKVLKISGSSADLERHPEKRMKAAWAAFEEKHLPRLRNENPNMRLSQVKQLLHREWLKSPENPMNSAHAHYNEK